MATIMRYDYIIASEARRLNPTLSIKIIATYKTNEIIPNPIMPPIYNAPFMNPFLPEPVHPVPLTLQIYLNIFSLYNGIIG